MCWMSMLEEIKKYGGGRYTGTQIDLKALPDVLGTLPAPKITSEWHDYVSEMKSLYSGRETSSTAKRLNTLSPYDVVRRLSEIVARGRHCRC